MKASPFIIALLAIAGCAPVGDGHPDTSPTAISVIEESPSGLFVRLSSPDKVTRAQLLDAVARYAQEFDRIDFCLSGNTAHGQEYISVIGGVVFDHDADQCYTLTTSDYEIQ